MSEWLLFMLVLFSWIYLIVCVVYIWKRRHTYYDPWKHTKRRKR